jgi:hypothetical protein
VGTVGESFPLLPSPPLRLPFSRGRPRAVSPGKSDYHPRHGGHTSHCGVTSQERDPDPSALSGHACPLLKPRMKHDTMRHAAAQNALLELRHASESRLAVLTQQPVPPARLERTSAAAAAGALARELQTGTSPGPCDFRGVTDTRWTRLRGEIDGGG